MLRNILSKKIYKSDKIETISFYFILPLLTQTHLHENFFPDYQITKYSDINITKSFETLMSEASFI